MLIGTRALVPRLRDKPDLHFDVFPLPNLGRFRTVADITGYCLSKDTENVDAAADFMAFASGDEGSQIMAETGSIVPANIEAAALAAVHRAGHVPAQQRGVRPGDPARRPDAVDPPAGPTW